MGAAVGGVGEVRARTRASGHAVIRSAQSIAGSGGDLAMATSNDDGQLRRAGDIEREVIGLCEVEKENVLGL